MNPNTKQTKRAVKKCHGNQDLKAVRKRRYCPRCGVEVTSADDEAGACTNCGVKL